MLPRCPAAAPRFDAHVRTFAVVVAALALAAPAGAQPAPEGALPPPPDAGPQEPAPLIPQPAVTSAPAGPPAPYEAPGYGAPAYGAPAYGAPAQPYYLPDAEGDEEEPIDPDGDGMVPRSVPRRTAGQVLVTLSGASLLGSLAVGVAGADCQEFGCIVHFFFTVPLATQGVVLGAIGIPLWASGAAEIPVSEALEAAIPAVEIGAGTASLSWRF